MLLSVLGLLLTCSIARAELSIHESRVLHSVPLTKENFDRAKNIKVDDVPRKYPLDVGGPLSPKFITNGVEGTQTKVFW